MIHNINPTISEVYFVKSCAVLGIPCEYVETPDYVITLSGHTVFAEVKQLDENEQDKSLRRELEVRGTSSGWGQAVERVRRKIKAANPQLKKMTNGCHPGVLVLYCNTPLGDYDAQDIHDAMYGHEVFTFTVPRDDHRGSYQTGSYLDNDGKLTTKQNTSTSAIVSLRGNADRGFTWNVYHNKYASVPLRPEWLRGDSVSHFVSKVRKLRSLPEWFAM